MRNIPFTNEFNFKMGLKIGPSPKRDYNKMDLPYDVNDRINFLKNHFIKVDIDNIIEIASCPIFRHIVNSPNFTYSYISGSSVLGRNINSETCMIKKIISNFESGNEMRSYCIYDIQYPYIRGAYLDIDNIILRESKINKILD